MKISDRIRGWIQSGRRLEDLKRIADELDAAQPKPKWFWGKPDKPGIWYWGWEGKKPDLSRFCLHDGMATYADGWWAYLGPIPEIEAPDKPKKYRTPTLPDDAGKECEFFDKGSDWGSGVLAGFSARRADPWIDNLGCHWADCRIEVTECKS